MEYFVETFTNLIHQTAFFQLTWGNYLMVAVACVFLYLAIRHEFEPLLLVPIAFGMLLVNLYPDIMKEISYIVTDTAGNKVHLEATSTTDLIRSLLELDNIAGVKVEGGGLLRFFYVLDEY